MKIKDGIKLLFEKVRNRWAAVAATVIMGAGVAACDSKNSTETIDKKTDSIENTIKIKNPVKQIKYLTDTLSAASGRALLFYGNGYITRNYVDKNNMYMMNLSLFSHEDWHAYIDQIKWRSLYQYTPYEYYKLCMHNEITANIAALLTTRYQYMVAENKKEFAKGLTKGVFGFYYKEVLRGKIKPESKNPKVLEKEFAFIANGMKKAWMERYGKWYMPSIYAMMQRYVGNRGLIEDSKKTYGYIRRYMYTIGGVDFSKYLKEDIMPSDTRVFLADGLRSVKSMRDGGAEIMNCINDSYVLLENIGFEKQKEAFQHLLISSKLKYELRNRTPEELHENPQIADMYYRQTLAKLQNDKSFAEYVDNFSSMNEKSCALKVDNDEEYEKTIKQMYTRNGVNLLDFVKDFKVSRVPVKTSDFEEFDFIGGEYYRINFSAMYGDSGVDRYSGPIIMNVSDNSAKPRGKYRRSDWQFIVAPDYGQPILTAASAKDMELIFKAIKDFEAIPQVLKECDTEAQKKYYAALKKNAAKQNKKRQTLIKSSLGPNKNSARNR